MQPELGIVRFGHAKNVLKKDLSDLFTFILVDRFKPLFLDKLRSTEIDFSDLFQ